ncbi:MAG: GHKL domain-containing protein [Ruminococcus sp.]|nr:GHKL domain-containing protein [Ruminococcus sp.]
MNTVNPLELSINVLLLLGYVFANFRLTRLIYQRSKFKVLTKFVAYLISFLMCTALLLHNHYCSAYLLTVLCQYGILFLYKREWKHNLFSILKMFGTDFLSAELFLMLSNWDFDIADWEFFFLLLSPVKLIAVLMLESALRRREKERINLQMQMYKHQMEIMEQSQAQIRFLRHDIKNHLLHMNHLLSERDTESLTKYINETMQHLDIPQEYVRSGNRDIDSLLNYKLMTAKQSRTDIVTDVKIPAELHISSFDLNVILGNLLDNALDALEHCENRRLTVSLRYESGLLYILVQNTCCGEPSLVSAKGAGHGIGLYSIRHTLETYQGDLKISYHDNMFTATVMLYLNR